MKIFLCILLIVFISLVIINKKYISPYKLRVIVAPKGAGKTMYLSILAWKYYKKWRKKNKDLPKEDCPIYTNFGIFHDISSTDYYLYSYPKNSLILIDEIGIVHDNRGYKSFPNECRDFYKYQRKRKLYVYACSQDMDFDKKIRKVCDGLYLLKRVLLWVFVLPYRQTIALKPSPQTGGEDLCDTLKKGLPCGVFFIPRHVKKFDTLFELKF